MNRWTVGSDPSGPGAITVHPAHVDLEPFVQAMQSVIQAIQAIHPIGASCNRLAGALRSPLGAEEDPHGWTYPEADAMSWTPPESGVEGVPRWLA